MNGVMIPVVSAGSNHPGASEMCTAHVSSPAGACERAFVGTISPRSRSKARSSAERETTRSGTRSVMRNPPLLSRNSFGSEAEDRRTEPEALPIIRGRRTLSMRRIPPSWEPGGAEPAPEAGERVESERQPRQHVADRGDEREPVTREAGRDQQTVETRHGTQ